MRYLTVCLLCLFPLVSVRADFASWKNRALSVFKESEPDLVGSTFGSSGELAEALREALAVAAERALKDLSKRGGFAESDTYSIPLPQRVESLRKPLQLVDREDLLEDFQATLDRSAEKGLDAAPEVVKGVIQSLPLKDLNSLWKGKDDAMTRLLERKSRDDLAELMLPLINEAIEETGATRSFEKLQTALPNDDSGFLHNVQTFTGLGARDFDLGVYVNEKALDALFTAMAAEEKAIREDPAARSSKLLKELFGAGE